MRLFLLAFVLTNFLLANIGNVLAMRGETFLERGLQKKALKIGNTLLEGDIISTGLKSRVQIMLKDRTIITIGSNSIFKFNEFFFDGSYKSKVKMEAKRGFFRAVSGQIGKIASKRFTVKTTSATIGIRGTDFSAFINDEREYYRCFSGVIIISIAGDTRELIPGDILRLDKKLGKLKVLRYSKPPLNPNQQDPTGDKSSADEEDAIVLEEYNLDEIDTIMHLEAIENDTILEGVPCTEEDPTDYSTN